MLGKKMVSFRKLAKKVNKAKNVICTDRQRSSSSVEPYDYAPPQQYHESLLSEFEEGDSQRTPTGFLAVYVGEDRRRFVVPTRFLSHPLFKMLLEKAYDEFGFQQRNGLVVPCSVFAFQEVVNAVECSSGRFDFGKLVEEFL